MAKLGDFVLNQLYQHNQQRKAEGYDQDNRHQRQQLASDIRLRKDLEISRNFSRRSSSREGVIGNGSRRPTSQTQRGRRS